MDDSLLNLNQNPNLPQIKVEINPDLDAEEFVNFLWHPFFKQNRQMIIKMYPNIEVMMGSDFAKENIKKFVLDLHQQKNKQLERIKTEQEKIVAEKGRDAFARLGIIMDYTWENPFTYTAYLSLLPFSPFKEDHFLYSALGQLNISASKNKSVLMVAVHEISHLIFLHYLKGLGIQLSEGTKHLFKEALTAAVLQDIKLSTILSYRNSNVNPEIKELYVKKDDRILKATDYLFSSLIENNLNQNFLEQMKGLLEEFQKSNKDFDEKMNFWHKHGKLMFKTNKLLKQYQEPVSLN